ncbi:MAG TPA: type II toxin-antitoxin system HicB family antitoxin [Gemmatales bacterium]|nr:type II toxin-antitoxin system HicB family antitoxin [Gemmatales bacterium]HMP58419.1 type II toxin-antitoxin system HicB family antitoxin [Gemmatales bacterium]
MIAEGPVANNALSIHLPHEEWPAANGYRLHVLIRPEPLEGGGFDFSTRALNLRGVAGTGDTKDEALASIRTAAEAAILTYLERGQEIPWNHEPPQIPPDCEHKWIIVVPHA